MPINTGIAFEEYVWSNWWLRTFPTRDWSSDAQVPLARGYKVDFVAYRGNERAIGDAKDKACLTFQDIGKLIEDAGIYKARARQNGTRLGRPQTAALQADEVRKFHRAGVSKAEIARRLQIGRTSVRRILTSKRP